MVNRELLPTSVETRALIVSGPTDNNLREMEILRRGPYTRPASLMRRRASWSPPSVPQRMNRDMVRRSNKARLQETFSWRNGGREFDEYKSKCMKNCKFASLARFLREFDSYWGVARPLPFVVNWGRRRQRRPLLTVQLYRTDSRWKPACTMFVWLQEGGPDQVSLLNYLVHDPLPRLASPTSSGMSYTPNIEDHIDSFLEQFRRSASRAMEERQLDAFYVEAEAPGKGEAICRAKIQHHLTTCYCCVTVMNSHGKRAPWTTQFHEKVQWTVKVCLCRPGFSNLVLSAYHETKPTRSYCGWSSR